jgi:hypothetical protein
VSYLSFARTLPSQAELVRTAEAGHRARPSSNASANAALEHGATLDVLGFPFVPRDGALLRRSCNASELTWTLSNIGVLEGDGDPFSAARAQEMDFR